MRKSTLARCKAAHELIVSGINKHRAFKRVRMGATTYDKWLAQNIADVDVPVTAKDSSVQMSDRLLELVIQASIPTSEKLALLKAALK